MSRVAPTSAEWTGLVLFATVSVLFYLFSRPRVPHGPAYSAWLFVLVVFVGTLARWVLAWHMPGNYDRESWQIASDIFTHGGNIYAQTDRYHYSPLWFWTLGILRRFSEMLPVLSFAVLVRLFLTAVDLATALVLWSWPRLSVWERTRQAAFFYLNPVSYLLTGAHGQFENLCLFLLVLALRVSATPLSGRASRYTVWILGTLAVLVKQVVFFELPVLILHLFRKWKALGLLALSALVFCLSFAPYWEGGREGIWRNVLLYRSYLMPYGLASLKGAEWLTPVFVAALCVYSFTRRDRRLSTKMLLTALFFLTFTTGFGVQYLILPVVFGVLRPTRGFFIYSFTAGAHLMGSYYNLGIPAFSWIPLWAVWAAAAYWWISIQMPHRTQNSCDK